jgi:RHS repeat-associated protein
VGDRSAGGAGGAERTAGKCCAHRRGRASPAHRERQREPAARAIGIWTGHAAPAGAGAGQTMETVEQQRDPGSMGVPMSGKVTAVGLDVITERSGHAIAPVTPSVCLTPAAPSPIPVPYPVMGNSAEGIVGAPSRTKINGVKAATVGAAVKASHGNEPGTLKEVVSHNTGGPCPVLVGAPIVLVELGMAGVTGSPMMENRSPGGTGRTAPAPMIGASMAFGTAVAGGGGNGGGADGDGHGDGAGAGGAGDGGNGGGAPAGQDGQCSGGHPVDVITGRAYTLPAVDLELPGPLPLTFVRVYSTTAAERDVGLGFGWSCSWSWEIEVRRRALVLWGEDGVAVDFPVLDVGAEHVGAWGWALRRERERFVLDKGDGVSRIFAAVDEDARRWKLIEIRDRNGNRAELLYDERGRLCEVTDSVGRVIGVETTSAGRIGSIQIKNPRARGRWIKVVRYAYDDGGHLGAVIDAEGHATRYEYDNDHRLTRETDRTGLSFCFVYDRAGRCVETWGEHPGRRDPSLAEDVPTVLADGAKARGIHHVRLDYHPGRYTEVADSTQITRYFGNVHGLVDKQVNGTGVEESACDARGLVIAEMDGEAAVTRTTRDPRGRVAMVIDPLGRVTRYERDEHGDVIRFVDPAGGTYELHRDERGNVVHQADPTGATCSATYDAHGLVTSVTSPTGGVTRLAYDAEGNLVEQIEPTGARWQWSHDVLGRRVLEVDPLGRETRFAWTERGDLAAVFHANDTTTRYLYDGERRLTEIQGPGQHTTGLAWGGFGRLVARIGADGQIQRFRYNREGELTEVQNELGEQHRLHRNSTGLVTREETFDGRTIKYRYDHAGRLASVETAGEITEHAYNAAGELVSRTLPDETVESFERNARGELVRVTWPGGEVHFERDQSGRVLCEVQAHRGEEHSVTSLFDHAGARVRRISSRGLAEHLERDRAGARTRTILDETQDVLHERDPLGRERMRALPRGGRIHHAYDALGRVSRRWATSPGETRPVRFDDPGWASAEAPTQPPRVTAEREFNYSAEGELADALDRRLGWVQYNYDSAGRLTELHYEATGVAERFSYDAAGNPHDVRADHHARDYGPGGRLRCRADTIYQWDAAGRLAEKRTSHAGGAVVWRYAWTAAGMLAAVELPDGRREEYAYDPLGRRMEARLYHALPLIGRPRLQERTRFVWDGDTIAHAICTRVAETGELIVEERAFCFEDGGFVPWAQCDDVPDGFGGRSRTWAFFVNDAVGTPDELVGSDGAVLAELERQAWGRVTAGKAATPLRFQGQFGDRATGLHYNRFRYYDPEAGLYLSPDPIGLDGGLRAYGYGINPVRWIDPLGLAFNTPNTGVVYLRTDNAQNEYVGRSKSKEAFERRKAAHRRSCPAAGYDCAPLQAGIGNASDLAQAEEDWIRAGGGPGRLQNKIHAQAAKKYNGKVPFP